MSNNETREKCEIEICINWINDHEIDEIKAQCMEVADSFLTVFSLSERIFGGIVIRFFFNSILCVANQMKRTTELCKALSWGRWMAVAEQKWKGFCRILEVEEVFKFKR